MENKVTDVKDMDKIYLMVDNKFVFLFLTTSTKIIKTLVKIYSATIIKIDLPKVICCDFINY